MQIPSEPHPCRNQTPLELGLKALSLDPEKHTSHKSCSMMLSDFLSPTSSSVLFGDYIGMESSVDVLKDSDVPNVTNCPDGQGCNFSQKLRGKKEQKWARKNKEFPPPIPWLARTENLPAHMPWVLKRHYTSDGRLILTEEKVRHHEYFRAHRSNGRLTLQLVTLDDEILIPPFVCDVGNKDGNGKGIENECDDHDQNFDDDDDDHVVEDQAISGIGGSPGKCFNFNSLLRGSPCIFGVPVPAIRHVHS
ncbi:uncharacterized protein Pyn_04256 [Prunus yedoensis var. nudiflora]|uniref:FAF domain-containing protein n=1 Tax=Prunus yedoensis var. nudiflora TaxID=2094558 RepID=A0A314Z8S9_PRUYE|nr:uncharacterized protein Pyn_04256 [Prunus yedoensis var. nudiflora]